MGVPRMEIDCGRFRWKGATDRDTLGMVQVGTDGVGVCRCGRNAGWYDIPERGGGGCGVGNMHDKLGENVESYATWNVDATRPIDRLCAK